MKKFVLIIAAVLFGTAMAQAATAEDKVAYVNLNAGNSFIFVENGVTFSVFPDGEFDFYVDNRLNIGAGPQIGNVAVTFNSGFDYNPYVQFDDFGAVIQVENIPIFYDFYGRVSQIGSVNLNFNNGFVNQIGGMNIFYSQGAFSHFNGFINIHNRRYIYSPFHSWFARPTIGFFNVWNTPYRRFYTPVRYTWYSPYRNNVRRAYAEIGREHRYNNVRRERASIYRNDKRVAVRDNAERSNRTVATRSNSNRTNTVVKRENGRKTSRSVASNGTTSSNRSNSVTNRTATVQRNANTTSRSNTSSVRDNQRTAVTNRTVTRTPSRTTVSRTTTAYKKPETRSSNVQSRQRSASTRTVRSAPSRSTGTVSRTTSSSSVSKAPARSSSRSATTRTSNGRRQ